MTVTSACRCRRSHLIIMTQSKNINYFSVADVDLHEVAGISSHIFDNDDLSIILNGKPSSSPFLHEGQIYQLPEPRLILVMDGEADVYLNLEQYHISKGTAILTTPDMIMEMERYSPEALISAIAIKEHFAVTESIVAVSSHSDFTCLLRMLYLLWDIANEKPFRRDTVRQMVMAMISNVLYIKQAADSQEPAPVASRGQQLFQQFKDLVSQHCEHERSIPFYADCLHITPHHLSAVIGKTSGHSVMYWVNRALLLRAKVLLRTSNLMTYEVAQRLHFANPPAFNNFFKRETGMTPREYRESFKQP